MSKYVGSMIPDDLYEWLKNESEKNDRSIAAEVRQAVEGAKARKIPAGFPPAPNTKESKDQGFE